MQHNGHKLFEFFIQFDQKTLAKAKKLLLSGYFNAEKIGLDLFDYLADSKNKSQLGQIKYMEVFEKISPQKKIKDAYARMIMARLQDFMEKFIAIEFGLENELMIPKIMRQFGLNKNYVFLLNKLHQKQPHFNNLDAIYNQIELFEELNNKIYKFEKSNISKIHQYTMESDRLFDYYFVLSKLKSYITLSNFQRVAGLEFNIQFEKEIKDIIHSTQFDDIDIINIYKNCYKMQFERDETSFKYLKNVLVKKEFQLEIEEKKEINVLMNNYCIAQINAQNFDYFNELFSLYKNAVEEKLILEENIIVQSTFRNYVQTALRVDEVEWAKNFVRENTNYLKKEEKETAVAYAMAMISFKEQKYKETIEYLQRVSFTDFQYDMQARILLSKAYFELKEFDSLEYLVKSSLKFLQRESMINQSIKQSYKNFLNFMLKLIDQQLIKKSKNLAADIAQEKLVAEKAWLIEKVK
ncbi:MAG: hypothetical protein KA797_09050 [Chitinophagales bacterium]|nr:hypothetical protein [Chitinophagales bacterium]